MKTLKLIITIIWILDIINIPQMQFLDTTIPLNFWFWLLYACVIGLGTGNVIEISSKKK